MTVARVRTRALASRGRRSPALLLLLAEVAASACAASPASLVSPAPTVAAPKVRVRASPIYVWCQDPASEACERVSAALGVMPVVASQIPAPLLEGFQDLPDDCSEPETHRIVERVSAALGLDPRAWSDQVGTSVPEHLVPERWQGGGCITHIDRQRPTVKIHAQPATAPPTFLVRVWEAGTR